MPGDSAALATNSWDEVGDVLHSGAAKTYSRTSRNVQGRTALPPGLIVPGSEGSCRIRVGNDVRCWKEGKSLIFDDSHPHEVWNDCDSYRVVLFVDFLRPVFFPPPYSTG